MPERYYWTATYCDGRRVCELQEDGATLPFSQLDLSGIIAFEVVDVYTGRQYRVCLCDGGVPVFFRRRTITLTLDGSTSQSTLTCIGREGAYLFLDGQGNATLTTDHG